MIGLPPGLGSVDPPIDMPPARFVLIEEVEGGHYLFRFSEDGADAGDTWHETLRDALDQGGFEFGLTEDKWRPLPMTADPYRYVEALARGEAQT